jgi:tRNA 2-thiouridine synthesizing protein A
MAAIMVPNCMEHTLDARGLACPLPLVKAKAALAGIGPDDVLVVLATDPEAPIDVAALAADEHRAFAAVREGAHWRLELSPAPPHARGGAGRAGAT